MWHAEGSLWFDRMRRVSKIAASPCRCDGGGLQLEFLNLGSGETVEYLDPMRFKDPLQVSEES